ncbi:hypothetical protein ACLOJK_003150 [Asimina triloba]
MESHEKAMDEIKSTDVDAWIEPATGDDDVTLKILYCGIGTDLHFSKNDWGTTTYPIVGSKVTKFKVRDKAGVGCLVGSCGSCTQCKDDLENYCPKLILTYNDVYHDGTRTDGGYSNVMVVGEHFAVRIPESLPLAGAAPLLCAGITVYSPMVYLVWAWLGWVDSAMWL